MTAADPTASSGAGRVAVIGDVGGHWYELSEELVILGADPETLLLPADLTVVQVGDLVHRGPDSERIVSFVDRCMGQQPGRWVQLAGNHEAQYLRPPAFEWPEAVTAEAVETMRAWWSAGRMRVAAVVSSAEEDLLVTHAGLTEGFWRQALGSPASPGQAATAINSFIATHEDVLFSAGEMLGGGAPNLSAGPVWASTSTELIPSWLGAGCVMPFSQVHGHSGVMDWGRRRVRADFACRVMIDEDAAHEFVEVPGGRIIGIDPGHGRQPHWPWRSLVIEDATVR